MSSYSKDLSRQLFTDTIEHVPNRKGFGEGLVFAADQDDRVVALCADLTESTQMEAFMKKYPERFVEVGITEQNMAAVGAGLAAVGKTPFISSYAAFSLGRNFDQIRVAICMNEQPVIVVGSHAGVSVGPDGGTHQMLEDIAMMRALPNMVVVVPCDVHEARKATLALAHTRKPAYLRLAREKTPVITTQDSPFQLGKAQVWREGNDVALIVAGPLAYEALKAAELLTKDGVQATVVNSPSIKPLDDVTILDAVTNACVVVTIEEAQVAGGLGGAVAELLGEAYPVPLERIGVKDTFGQSGTVTELWEHYGLTAAYIVKAAHRAMKRKSKKMKKFDVVVVGTATRDVYLISKDFAAFDSNGEPVIIIPANTKIDMPDIASDIGGGAPNAAVTFARAGFKTACIAKVGLDGSGKETEAVLEKERITSLLIKDKSHQTGLSLVLKGPNGEDTMFVHRGAGYEYRAKDFDLSHIQTKWLYITSLGGDLTVLDRLIKWAEAQDVRVAVNPGPLELAKPKRLLTILRRADVVIMNRREAELVFDVESVDEMLVVGRGAGLHTIVITDSQNGATVLDGSYVYSAGIYKKVAVVDRSGAGYAYGSGLITAIMQGKTMQQAMSFAAANATSVISYLGSRVGILSNTDVDIMKVDISVFH